MPETKERSSVYEQIGGEDAILVTVETFYQRVLGDPLLQSFFEGIDMVTLKRQQIDFFSQALGGPNIYRGPDMKTAHAHMSIEQRHFDRVAQHLIDTLKFLGVAQEHIDMMVQTVWAVGCRDREYCNCRTNRNNFNYIVYEEKTEGAANGTKWIT